MSVLFEKAIAAFDDYNRKDPNTETAGGKTLPKELLYAQRMSACLVQFMPDASEALRLAIRCQHIGRWEIPRETYPKDRVGYLQWRNKLKEHHAEIASTILSEIGYDEETIDRVKFIVQKKQLRHDDESQALEDVVCLVFLEYYFEEFARQHEEDKVISILQKTWNKMSEKAKEAALKLKLSEVAKQYISRALN